MNRLNFGRIVAAVRELSPVREASRCLPRCLSLPFFSSDSNVVMEVTKSRFPAEVGKIIQHVSDAHFIAFDFEFSGIAERRKQILVNDRPREKLTLQELYDDTKVAAQKYQILQVGLTVVEEDVKNGCYIARPYNFNINPVPAIKERYFAREWSYHSGAVDFLLRNNFKFDLPLTHGIPYLSPKEEAEVREAWTREEAERKALPDMPLKEEDVPLINHIKSSILAWQAAPDEERDSFLNIPAAKLAENIPDTLNRYQVRLTHQIVHSEYPELKTNGMGHFVQITKPTDEQQASEKAIQEQSREREMSKAVGFRWLLDAIMGRDITKIPEEYLLPAMPRSSKPTEGETALKRFTGQLQQKLTTRRRIVVGHNCFTDLVNFYNCFVGDLPDKVEEFQESINTLFPAIVDTKYMASLGKGWRSTSLEDVEGELRKEKAPKIEVPRSFDLYTVAANYHEAGFDSLMTAKVAIKLSTKLQKDSTISPSDSAAPDAKPFGVGEHGYGYVTAAESVDESENEPETLGVTIATVLSTPVSAVKNFFGSNKLAPPRSSFDVRGKEDVSPSSASSSTAAVKDNSEVASQSKKVQKAQMEFADKNMYEILSAEAKGTGELEDSTDESDLEEDLMTFSDNDESRGKKSSPRFLEQEATAVEEEKRLAKLIEKGQMMPRWDGSRGVWQVLGNRLQVNGCEEKVWRLA